MNQLAEGLHHIELFPRSGVNAYLIGDVLIDAGVPQSKGKIFKELEGRSISAHALTHAHLDHFGASHAVCERYGVPLWCGTADAGAVETGTIPMPDSPIAPLMRRAPSPATHKVARRLNEGDEVAGFRVLETPGHSQGHIAFWRESDRVLVLGDVLTNMNLFTTAVGLHQPPRYLTFDPVVNRRSARRLAELEPSLACFGHGPPLRDPRRFVEFAARLTG
jgi:glyoxylase-like metal-dependent hydrolase (beta-lactamase superfamily II)